MLYTRVGVRVRGLRGIWDRRLDVFCVHICIYLFLQGVGFRA